MKERPMLFIAPMVRALLDGTKTQTRREVKPQPYLDEMGNACWNGSNFGQDANRKPHFQALASPLPSSKTGRVRCPFGQPGDRLRGRETFFAWGRWETRYSAKKGRDEWHFVDMTLECGKAYLYATDGDHPQPLGGRRQERGGVAPSWWKRPSIHMPLVASRITLEITGVSIERLQDISDADALAEGVDRTNTSIPGYAKERFRRLWEQINGPGSWDANPWVWAIEFKRI